MPRQSPAISGARLAQTCDTLPGNSGPPVIDAGVQTVIGLHHAGSRRDSVNLAIPMRLILDRWRILSAALEAPAAAGRYDGGDGARTGEDRAKG